MVYNDRIKVQILQWQHVRQSGAALHAAHLYYRPCVENGMRKTWWSLHSALLFSVLVIGPVSCMAQDCDIAADAINHAAELLKEVGRQTNLEGGRHLARGLQRALSDAAIEASECECEQSAVKLDAAAARVRQARSLDSCREFSDQINHAIDDFNVGVTHMEICIVD